MPDPLIGPTEYPSIRALVGMVTAAELPDAVLELPIYVPAAIQDVLDVVPDAEERTDPVEVAHLQNAAVYFAAIRVGPFVDVPKSERWDDYGYTGTEVDWEARVAYLRRLALDELGAVEEALVAESTSPLFTVLPSGYPRRASYRSLPGVSAGGPDGRGTPIFGGP